VSLVLLKMRSHSYTHDGLAGDIRAVARHFPKVPIVVITSHDDAAHVETAVAAGAQGLIPVTASLRIAVAALQLVLAGGTYYPQSVLDNGRLKASTRHTDPVPTEPPITRPPEMPPHSDPPRSTGLSVAGDADHLMVAFTAREADVLAALQRGRSNKWIAHHLNLSENTVKVHIRHIMRKLRATNRTEAVVLSHQWLPDLNGR
jgi:DNA-binding NarL/FixJ family response regulator